MMVLGPERGIVIARLCGVRVIFLFADTRGKLTETSIGVFWDSKQ